MRVRTKRLVNKSAFAIAIRISANSQFMAYPPIPELPPFGKISRSMSSSIKAVAIASGEPVTTFLSFELDDPPPIAPIAMGLRAAAVPGTFAATGGATVFLGLRRGVESLWSSVSRGSEAKSTARAVDVRILTSRRRARMSEATEA
jgi:hypothetical protein